MVHVKRFETLRIARLRFADDFSFRHAGKHHGCLFGPGFILLSNQSWLKQRLSGFFKQQLGQWVSFLGTFLSA
jgi:hypothetical protein